MWKGSARVNTVLTREYTGHSKHLIPTQETTLHMNITRWSIPKSDWLYSLNWRWEAQYSQQKQDLELTGSDHELLIAKVKLKWKKLGKTTRPIRYDLNQIPYDYTVEVIHRFKGLGLVDRVPKELWTEVHNTVQEAMTKTVPNKKKCKKASGCLRRLANSGKKKSEKQETKGKIYPSECRVPENIKKR